MLASLMPERPRTAAALDVAFDVTGRPECDSKFSAANAFLLADAAGAMAATATCGDAALISALTWPRLTASFAAAAFATVMMRRKWPGAPTEITFAALVTELVPIATDCENFAAALVPIAIALLASARDFVPTAMVSLVEIASPASRPSATLEWPITLLPALDPSARLYEPFTNWPASAPPAVFLLPVTDWPAELP
jgi:hypothetical protein